MEPRMSLGYQRGKFWVPDDRFAMYSQRDSYKALIDALPEAGFSFTVEYSYTSRQYAAEIITIRERNVYHHNNAFDANPMAAASRAIRESGRATPLVQACLLVIETELLGEAITAAEKRQEFEDRVSATLDTLGDILRSITLVEPLSASPDDVAAAQWENIQSGRIAYPDEDDDL